MGEEVVRTPVPMVPDEDVDREDALRLRSIRAPGFSRLIGYIMSLRLRAPCLSVYDPFGGGDLGFGEGGSALAGIHPERPAVVHERIDYARHRDHRSLPLQRGDRWGERPLRDFQRPEPEGDFGRGGSAQDLPQLNGRPVMGDRREVVLDALEAERISPERAAELLAHM